MYHVGDLSVEVLLRMPILTFRSAQLSYFDNMSLNKQGQEGLDFFSFIAYVKHGLIHGKNEQGRCCPNFQDCLVASAVGTAGHRPLPIILNITSIHTPSVYPYLTAVLRCYNAHACTASLFRRISFPRAYIIS